MFCSMCCTVLLQCRLLGQDKATMRMIRIQVLILWLLNMH